METIGYLADAQLGGLQQESGLHQEHLIDIINNGAALDLTNHTCLPDNHLRATDDAWNVLVIVLPVRCKTYIRKSQENWED